MCGFRSKRRQIRPIVDLDSPDRFAIEALDQCVAPFGASSSVAVTTSSTLSSNIDGGRPGRGSSARPSSRRSMNRARHFATVCSHTPSRAATCLLSNPSAQPSTIRHRSASACAEDARRAHRSNWDRSASVRSSAAFGRPERARSTSPSARSAANRRRTELTVIGETPRSRATRAYTAPGSAHASTIRARVPNRDDSCDQATSRPRSLPLSTNSAGRTAATIRQVYKLMAAISGAGH